jgi:hypothetical protein
LHQEAAVFTLTCPDCGADVSLPARRLLLRADEDDATAEVLFTCLSCSSTVTLQVEAAGVVALMSAGVTTLTLTEPVVEHPESHAGGPPLTADDLIDLHADLEREAWAESPAHPDC